MAYYLSNFFFKHNKTSISGVYFYLLTNQIPKLYVQNIRYPDRLTPLHKFTADICKAILRKFTADICKAILHKFTADITVSKDVSPETFESELHVQHDPHSAGMLHNADW